MTVRRGIPPLLLTVLLAGCSGPAPPEPQIGRVARAPVREIVEAPASVAARATAALVAPASGTVAALYVQDGDTVKKGQILARIRSPQAETQLDEARRAARRASRPLPAVGGVSPVRLPALKPPRSLDARLARCFADARKAARKVEDPAVRRRLLAAVDAAEAGSRAQRRALTDVANDLNRSIEQALSQVTGRIGAGLSGLTASMSSLQEASGSQARAAVRAAKATVDGLVIRAPFGGIVTLGGPSSGTGTAGLGDLIGRLPAGLSGQVASAPSGRSGGTVAAGVPVAAGDTVVTVTDVSTLTLAADVDETDVLLVSKGVPAEVEFDAVTGATYRAEVTGVGVTPKEGATGGVGYPVRLTLGPGAYDDGSPAPRPKPGMSAVVRLTVKESPDALAVPASAIVSSGKESVVWVVRNGAAERRTVRLGAQGDAEVEVVSGLMAGERIVVRGADTVHANQPIDLS
ncbi:efflux RND transporter periplasmic adaptor subunit [Microtetraspora glauca]|uniref:Biotin/lipoyl-binding protein n=1 Tax=Microtetraspora glauca TaxID=1996 RepID=A0ABV3GJY3_MICGL